MKLNGFSEFFDPYPQAYPQRGIAKSPLQAQPPFDLPLGRLPLAQPHDGPISGTPLRLPQLRCGSPPAPRRPSNHLDETRRTGRGNRVAKPPHPSQEAPSLLVHLVRQCSVAAIGSRKRTCFETRPRGHRGVRCSDHPDPPTIRQRLWVRGARSRSDHSRLFPKNRKRFCGTSKAKGRFLSAAPCLLLEATRK